jgi:hypothetical protein
MPWKVVVQDDAALEIVSHSLSSNFSYDVIGSAGGLPQPEPSSSSAKSKALARLSAIHIN